MPSATSPMCSPPRGHSPSLPWRSRARSRPATPKGSGAAPAPGLMLRPPPLPSPDTNIAGFAAGSRDAAGGNVLNLLHLMLARLHADMAHDAASPRTATTAAQAFALKRGAGRDFAHVFIAAARSLGIPARYV